MEKIRINGIEKKPSGLVIVKFTPDRAKGGGDAEATLNTKWQSQEVDYLEKDVGIGGECLVEIVVKGQYTNITKVDMTSAVKGNNARNPGQIPKEVQQGERSLDGQAQLSVNEEKNRSIIAQCLVKACIRNELPIEKGVEMYKKALELL